MIAPLIRKLENFTNLSEEEKQALRIGRQPDQAPRGAAGHRVRR